MLASWCSRPFLAAIKMRLTSVSPVGMRTAFGRSRTCPSTPQISVEAIRKSFASIVSQVKVASPTYCIAILVWTYRVGFRWISVPRSKRSLSSQRQRCNPTISTICSYRPTYRMSHLWRWGIISWPVTIALITSTYRSRVCRVRRPSQVEAQVS